MCVCINKVCVPVGFVNAPASVVVGVPGRDTFMPGISFKLILLLPQEKHLLGNVFR